MLNMEPLSEKEVEIIAWLEFNKRYFFTVSEIDRFAKSRKQRYNIVYTLLKKRRIVKLNRRRYFLVPIRAKGGAWSEHPFIIVDEMMDSKDYFIGGWAAAHHWRLTEQVPAQTDVYTTRRQGKAIVLSTRIVFHRTTRERLGHGVVEQGQNHAVRILSKEDSDKWLKLHR